ncbi:MAG TPA: hypothetical protein VE996_02865 [Terriglobales bacterium]|nr:hypothetical protein [Terriglobales bacterium]
MVLTLDEYLRARPAPAAEEAESSEILVARSTLAIVAARLCWSAVLHRKVAYLPDQLLACAPGSCVTAVRAYYGTDVLVVPESVRF